ncbi:unnamed protein product [Triticum turgidum subsp. durum]|uniref:Zinc finger GRF-type domain-containing protein n=1 Tax=Triticum turgidum subsp. durum TaxID=4567 RepID=A0A9R1QCM5_TRITD|nr:unnamed protein product [Triticum turgidum subsp. durum]
MKGCTSLSGKQQAGRCGAGASSSSSHPLPLNGCDLAGADMTKDGEPWAKITGEVRYMDVDFCKGTENLPEFDWGIPLSSPDVAFNGTDKSDHCCHLLNPARRVCSDGYDYGRIFLVCPREGYDTCAYLKWVDKEWQGRPRQVIGKLAEENVALQKFVFDKDAEIMRLKEERKAMIMKHKKEIRTRDRREIWLSCLVCYSALLYGVVALVIRGFV